MFAEYLEMVNLDSSFFVSADAGNRRKIMSFQRICFIIFAGCRDKYANRLESLLAKFS
jgi:hypothetical protein